MRIIVHSHYRSTAHHWRAINGHFMNSLIETPGAINSSMTINTFQYPTDTRRWHCWASVADGQPTSKQHRVNVCVFCGNVIPHDVHPKSSMLYHTMYILSHQCYTTRCTSWAINVIPHDVHPEPSMLYHTMYILSHQCYTTRCTS